ncbi:hypothetical protein KIL84_005278 [Mauremys mutica]|uniref:Uncharacterized protein n=1 Tax=Mauremys mutica TaxID=74926 RepID=A0A9D3XKD4_9SAUR|nr:hypothetical protein KIL84_005278 [Mauremys mutica]
MAKRIQQAQSAKRNKRQGGQAIVGVLLILAILASVLLGHLWTVSSEFDQYLHAPYGALKKNSYIKTILKELKFNKTVWGQEPQKCWEHKAINPISLVLMRHFTYLFTGERSSVHENDRAALTNVDIYSFIKK